MPSVKGVAAAGSDGHRCSLGHGVEGSNSYLPQAENQGAVGVDLDVSALATLATGERPVPGPKAHAALLARLKTLSRSLSRKEKGSANRKKAKAKLAKLHARIANIRSDALHQRPTSRAAATPSASRI